MATDPVRKTFFIDSQLRQAPEGNAAGMGFKAYNLARMAALGLRVPAAFVLSTGYCHIGAEERPSLEDDLPTVLAANVRRLEGVTGLAFGGARRPLLVSVRSGAPVSMPGMMETVLNVGLNDTTLRGLLRLTGNSRLVWDSYRRLVQAYAEVVDRLDPAPFEQRLQLTLQEQRADGVQELDARALSELTLDLLRLYRGLAGRDFPSDPMEQLRGAVCGVFASWTSERAQQYRTLNGIDESIGTAVTVQRMVFGNAGGTSGSGVAFTRNPATGEKHLYMDFLFNAQGEDVVSGRHAVIGNVRLGALLPAVEAQVTDIAVALEEEFQDVQEFEFTVQDEVLYLLQARTGKRSPLAALSIAVDLVREGVITPSEALARLGAIDLAALRVQRVALGAGAQVLCSAVPASPGVAIGAVAFDPARATQMAARGPVILVRNQMSTEDIGGLAVADGLLTALGGRTSHGAVVARQMGKVCLVGCEDLTFGPGSICIQGQRITEGETLCLDAEQGRVIRGDVSVVSEMPEQLLAEVQRWHEACMPRRPRNAQPRAAG